jgi:hypothetical protein
VAVIARSEGGRPRRWSSIEELDSRTPPDELVRDLLLQDLNAVRFEADSRYGRKAVHK